MLFSSPIFVFLFLPVVWIVNLFLPRKASNLFLLFFSLIFYGWGEPIFVLLLVALALFDTFAAGWIMEADGQKRRLRMAVTVTLNLLPLLIFKYLDFFLVSVGSLLGLSHTPVGLPLPIGVSFFTFQALSYVFDTVRGDVVREKNPLNVLLYLSFFPQLIAGPIVKFEDIAAEIRHRRVTVAETASGLRRFIIGFAKKVLLANELAKIVDALADINSPGAAASWLLGIGFSLQIYFDFSGYSDMAIGLGHMFGFHFKENFLHPYAAASLTDFWRRWHVSLSSWFRDYVYIPLGGNRRGRLKTARNRLVVFLLTGLWHGANFTFIIWGLFHGAMLTFERLIRLPKVLSRIVTLTSVVLAFMVFRADSLSRAGDYLRGLLMPSDYGEISFVMRLLTPHAVLVLCVSVFASLPWVKLVAPRPGERRALPMEAISYTAAGLLWIFCLLALSASSYAPFIYFRF
jgi:alginate O-acetyltransferase complex protein AlgI